MRKLLIGMVALAIGAALLLAQPEDDADIFHTVDAGDTLISIALAYGVTLDQLLTLNDLHPEALLQIGQRLLVIRAPQFADDADVADDAIEADTADTAAEDEIEAEAAIGGNVERGDLPPAPVIAAAAPMRDPADISPQLCYGVFLDDNQNGMRDAGEASLPAATIRLLDAQDVEQQRYTTDGAAQPSCERRLKRKLYLIEGAAPPGFGLTSASRLRLDLRSGGRVTVEFGAKQGLEALPTPPPERPTSEAERASAAPRSLLRELSGIFVLGLAVFVFFSGMALSFFIRGR